MANRGKGPARPLDGNIIVSCRFRPLNEKEKEKSMELNVEFPSDGKTVVINQQFEGFGQQRFNFDFVFPPSTEQKIVYETTAKQIVDAVMEGFNGTVFAYGQTSSGKTFTMAGPDIYDEQLKGIIPRMVFTVFDRISKSEEMEFLVKVGFCEIYNEKIKDLIDPTRKDLKVSEDKARGVYIAGLSEHYVDSGEGLLKFMDLGQANREVAFTNMNAGSSRSHSIFITTINQKSSIDFSEKTGKLFLVDLAGSEKVGKTGATGKTLEEAKNINKSLTCLGKVIMSLTDGSSTHVPYRDSKLTRVLQDSLGGNSKTALIITCSPSPYNESETISTLRFGIRAKAIKNKPKVNKEFTVAELKIMLARAEVAIMQKDKRIQELEDLLKKHNIALPTEGSTDQRAEEEENEMLKELKETKDNLNVEYEKNEKFQAEISELQMSFDTLNETLKNIKMKNEELDELVKYNEEQLESSNETNKTLEMELNQIINEKSDLEKRIENLIFELETVKNSKQEIQTPIIRKETSEIISIESEMDKFKSLESKILQIEDVLKSKLSSADDPTKIRELFIQSLIQERRMIDEHIFQKFLENYFSEVERLNSQVSQSNSKYQKVMNQLSSDQKKLKNDLERERFQVENLTFLYNKLSNEKTNFRIEQQLSKKKIEKLLDIQKEQNEEIESLKLNLDELTSQLSAKALEVVEMNQKDEPTPTIYSNVRKPIKGGSKFLTGVVGSDIRNVKFFQNFLKTTGD
ncbi:hypothetical protein SteCoe_9068 [Stentor coeruleus]|uniref:Kinesin-like protein n=1 Tax=Stentor coeruleus TaxID=5963 RepID=A0A1R2CIN5_9CILI|nr:hypothetical protein SteCoe_9068 [Stentor coeruleus]